LREALAARHDRDFVVAAPQRRNRARGTPARQEGAGARILSFVVRYPLEITATLLLTGAGAAIAWNALALQTVRHPAPLIGPRLQTEAAAPASRPRTEPPASLFDPAPARVFPDNAVPLPPRPVARDPAGESIRTGEPTGGSPAAVLPPARPAPAASAAPATITTPRRPTPVRDPIGDLIRLGEPAPIPPGLVGRAPGNIVSAGQRALSRLGYGVTVDGIMGPSTRQAIEQFERDRRLPVTGELGQQTARALTAHSGVPVE
jgi:hypothetical protein